MGTSIGGSMTYFAMDGNYGVAHGLIVINTAQWTDDDWDLIDEASDYDRFSVAITIAERYS
jgi:hypothetical protein